MTGDSTKKLWNRNHSYHGDEIYIKINIIYNNKKKYSKYATFVYKYRFIQYSRFELDWNRLEISLKLVILKINRNNLCFKIIFINFILIFEFSLLTYYYYH